MAAAAWKIPSIADPREAVDRALAYVLPNDFPLIEDEESQDSDSFLRSFLLHHPMSAAQSLALWCYLYAISLMDKEAQPRAESVLEMVSVWPRHIPRLRIAVERATVFLKGMPMTRALIDAPPTPFVDAITMVVAHCVAERHPGPRRLRGLIANDFLHPRDRALHDSIEKIPMLRRATAALLDYARRAQEIGLLADGVRVTQQGLPKLWNRYVQVCGTLGVRQPPPLYIKETGVQSGVIGVDEPAIVIGSMVPSFFDANEIRFLLGREVGHILAGHENYLAMTETVYGATGALAEASIPFARWGIDLAVGLRLCTWCRAAELSADRVGYLAVQDLEPVLRALMKQSGFPVRYYADINTRSLIEQTLEFRDRIDQSEMDSTFEAVGRLSSRTPYLVQRVSELLDWIGDGAPARVITRRAIE